MSCKIVIKAYDIKLECFIIRTLYSKTQPIMHISPLFYVTGFVKRGLPHASNSMNLEDHNLVVQAHTTLKVSPSINLCWFLLQPNF